MPDLKDMVLRDWFAAQALVGLLAGKAALQSGGFHAGVAGDVEKPFAESSYRFADAMMKARDK
ncbi:MAG TPA: hypothetical protein VG013_21250 [Gemmataceae bacterium]|jgi:hypothetical protein|nr:hypothetical protein [Gemmataceae bacterium]